MSLYRGKFRVESTRLKDWDYASPGWYFVTLCTHDRRCWFGHVRDGEVELSPLGGMVAEEWQRAPMVRPNVALDAWVIMPNHLHGIIIINPPALAQPQKPLAETMQGGKSGLRSGSLGAIVGQVKSICTKRIRAAGQAGFEWQERYYEHIIRDEGSLVEIREYIANNPRKWELDTLNPERASS